MKQLKPENRKQNEKKKRKEKTIKNSQKHTKNCVWFCPRCCFLSQMPFFILSRCCFFVPFAFFFVPLPGFRHADWTVPRQDVDSVMADPLPTTFSFFFFLGFSCILVVFEAPGNSNVHVWSSRVPTALIASIMPQDPPREEREERTLWQETEKSRNFGLPPFGAPPFRGPPPNLAPPGHRPDWPPS